MWTLEFLSGKGLKAVIPLEVVSQGKNLKSCTCLENYLCVDCIFIQWFWVREADRGEGSKLEPSKDKLPLSVSLQIHIHGDKGIGQKSIQSTSRLQGKHNLGTSGWLSQSLHYLQNSSLYAKCWGFPFSVFAWVLFLMWCNNWNVHRLHCSFQPVSTTLHHMQYEKYLVSTLNCEDTGKQVAMSLPSWSPSLVSVNNTSKTITQV